MGMGYVWIIEVRARQVGSDGRTRWSSWGPMEHLPENGLQMVQTFYDMKLAEFKRRQFARSTTRAQYWLNKYVPFLNVRSRS